MYFGAGSTFQGDQELGFERGKSEVSHSVGVTWVFGYADLEFCRVSCVGHLLGDEASGQSLGIRFSKEH